MENTSQAPAILRTVVALDCPDPVALATFYSGLTGWPIEPMDEGDTDWVQLAPVGQFALAFQRVDGFRAPQWPGQDVPQQAHLDLYLTDLDAAEAWARSQGARKPDVPDEYPSEFRVFLDPVGHPFCLCRAVLRTPDA